MASIAVTGTITRIFHENKGAEVTEFYTSKDGEQRQRKYTAWFETPQTFSVGQSGTFSGLLSAVIDDWKDKDGRPKLDHSGNPGRSVKVSINGTRYTADDQTVATSTPIVGDDAPF